jgi:hypothetical protein
MMQSIVFPKWSLTLIAVKAGLVQISLPSHFTAESANRCLRVCFHQQTQTHSTAAFLVRAPLLRMASLNN